MAFIFADKAGQKIFRKTSTYQDHKNRTPPSTDPGEDWGTGIGTDIHSIRSGGIVNNWGAANKLGGLITSITYNDLGIRFEFLHCKEHLKPSGYRAALGEVFAITGNTGNVPPHVHVNVYTGAHITSSGVIDKKGTRVDPAPYTENEGLVQQETKSPVQTTIDQVVAKQKELDDLKAQSAQALANLAQQKQTELVAKDAEIKDLHAQVETINRNLKSLTTTSDTIGSVYQAIDPTDQISNNVITNYGNWVDKTFSKDTYFLLSGNQIRGLLKYDILVAFTWGLGLLSAKLTLLLTDNSLDANTTQFVVVAIGAISFITKNVLTKNYDTNKDGKVDLNDLRPLDTVI